MTQTSKKKYIKQIKLQGNKAFFPNKFFSPYEFMDKFNESLKKRYDITVIEVKYVISTYLTNLGKSRGMKQIEEQFNTGQFAMETEYNNIYDIDNEFMKKILEDTKELVPPKDFDYDKLEEQN